MWGAVATALLVGLALMFYAIAGYHTILIFLGLRMTRGGPKPFDRGSLRNPVDLPSVSIVIPARDEEVVIEGALRCADRLQYPSDLKEVLLIEDGSHDATPTIGQRMASVLPNVRCLSGGPSKGKPPALNRAMAHARGDVIGVFDSDTRYQPDLLLRVAKYFHDHPDVSVAQAVPRVMNQHTNAITRLNYYETRFWFQGLQAAKERFGLFMHLAGTGMFLRRSVLEALGPWDEACLTEDLEYSLRLAQSGIRVGMLDANVWIQARVSGLPSRPSAGTLVERRVAGVRPGRPPWVPAAEAAQPRSPSRRRTSPYKSALIRNELRASFSRISRAREAGIVPASTPANRRPRRPVYSRPSASATVRAGISSRMRWSPFGVSNKDASPIPKPRAVHRFRSPRTGTTWIHDPRASRRGWDSRPVKTSSAIGGVIAICAKRSRRTRTSPMDSRAISVEASTQTRMGQPLIQAPVRSRSLRSSSSEIRKKGIPFAAARSAISRMGTPA